MSAEVYTGLYRENRTMVANGSCGVMNSLREDALAAFEKFGLPTSRQEEYLHTDVSEWFEPDWGMNLGRVRIPVEISERFRCSVPNLSTLTYFLANDRFVASDSSQRASLADGVIIGGLCEQAGLFTDRISGFYGKLADMRRSGIAALNTLFAQDGFVVIVPDGVSIEKPVQLVTLLQSPVDMMVTRRVLVVLGRGSRLKLLVCDHSTDSKNYLVNQVTEVFAEEDSSLELYDLEETAHTNKRVSELFIRQEAGSSVRMAGVTLNNGMTRNSVYVTLAGRGASLTLDGVAVADGSQHVDNLTFVDHQVPDCQSDELFKYVLDGDAVGSFAGKVLVREGSQRTVSQQTNRNICMKRTARMFTQPQLEIYADDVKCSHGATVGQLDDKALFYMRQRGISESDARTLLMMAFTDEVISRIGLEPLQQRLRHLVERRFKSGSNLCEGCQVCKI